MQFTNKRVKPKNFKKLLFFKGWYSVTIVGDLIGVDVVKYRSETEALESVGADKVKLVRRVSGGIQILWEWKNNTWMILKK